MGIGLLISSGAPNVTTATTIAPLFTMPIILFGGFISNTDSLPVWLGWIQWVSPVRFANEALSHSQLDGIPGLPAGFLTLEGFTVGEWKCILILFCYAIFWRVFSFLYLRLSIGKFQ